ncbi:hypothetical protein RQP46_006120 [Phenoliferia psychrophenolica]
MPYLPFDLYGPLAQAAHPEDLGNLSLVSKDWYKATRDEQDWKIVSPERLQSFLVLVKEHPPFAAHIRGLDYAFERDDEAELGTPLPDLRTRTLIELIKKCRRLRRLKVGALPAEPQDQKALFATIPRLPALRHLTLGHAHLLDLPDHSIQFNLLPFLFDKLPTALESLSLGVDPAPSEQRLQEVTFDGIIWPGVRIFNPDFVEEATVPLQKLHIGNITLSLEWLNRDMVCNLARAVFPAAQILKVDTAGMPAVKDEDMIEALGYASPDNLRTLELHYENIVTHTRITGAALSLPACANLTSFLLDGTKDDVETIQQLPKSLRQLYLVVSHRGLSGRGQKAIGDLHGNHHDKGEAFVVALIEALDSGALENLENIEASIRARVTDETAQALEQGCEGHCRLTWSW